MLYRPATLCVLLLLLIACSPHDTPPPAPKLFNDQREMLDKAKAVDGIVQQQDAAQRKAVEKQAE